MVACIDQVSLNARRGGTWHAIHQALKLGLVPGKSLFVLVAKGGTLGCLPSHHIVPTFQSARPTQVSWHSTSSRAQANPKRHSSDTFYKL